MSEQGGAGRNGACFSERRPSCALSLTLSGVSFSILPDGRSRERSRAALPGRCPADPVWAHAPAVWRPASAARESRPDARAAAVAPSQGEVLRSTDAPAAIANSRNESSMARPVATSFLRARVIAASSCARATRAPAIERKTTNHLCLLKAGSLIHCRAKSAPRTVLM